MQRDRHCRADTVAVAGPCRQGDRQCHRDVRAAACGGCGGGCGGGALYWIKGKIFRRRFGRTLFRGTCVESINDFNEALMPPGRLPTFPSGADDDAFNGLSWAPPNIMFCWAAGCWPPPTMTTMPATMVACLSS